MSLSVSAPLSSQEITRALHTVFARSLLTPFRRAIREYRLISPGDSIAVCISGGKDSMLLSLLLQDAQRHGDIPFSLRFLAMDPGYTEENRAHIEENARLLGIPITFFDTNVLRVAGKHAPDHPCFLCAKMRRGFLYSEARALGCNKIALGHHYDDAIETVLMGLLYGGQVQAMLPRLRAEHYPEMELIRPLYLTREQAVLDWVAYCGLTFLPCACPAAMREQDTNRKRVRRLIETLTAENPQVEKNILNAVKNVNTAKVLGWRDKAGKHSFLDLFGEER
jgi:tRNA(Ile)-lysidine synthase TilS/MesJ